MYNVLKQPFIGVLRKRFSENMQQIYRRTHLPSCDFNSFKTALLLTKQLNRHGCFPVNVLHIFRTSFLKNICGRLLLNVRLKSMNMPDLSAKSTKY